MNNKTEYTLEHLHEKELGQKRPPFNFLVSFVAFVWSLVQIWVASPIQYDVASYFSANWLILNDAQMRFIHLSFGMFLVFFLFPIHRYKSAIVRFLSATQNLTLSFLGSVSVLYLFVFYEDIANTIGMPSRFDIIVSVMGVIMLLEAARRTVGMAMTLTAVLFLAYSYFGNYMPDIIAHSGHALSSLSSHMWLSNEGVFGTPLGVSVDFIFLYVLFGNLLEKTGAGNFFVQLSFSLLGRFKAGPAKAAVVASGLMGMISGSSIANTITVGSITIPLMKRMGLSAEKAASIEVSAGVNGQVTPPIMGAAAFLIAEYLSMSYYEIVKMAFLPSLLTYVSLLYIVHIEGCKINMKTFSSTGKGRGFWGLITSMLSVSFVFVFLGGSYYLIEGFGHFIGLKMLFGDSFIYLMLLFLGAFYVGLKWFSHQYSALNMEISCESVLDARSVLKRGIHHFIPLLILVWCLMIEKLSPSLSAFWSIMFLLFELLVSKALSALFDKKFNFSHLKEGLYDVVSAMVSGSKSMIIVSIATAVAGIIVGSISLTGVGLKVTSILDYISNSNIIITLMLTAVTCIILGMGMPTTACYIIVSTLMIPALEYFIKKHGLDVPVFSLHFFVFYLGLMADVTPPVGLASYAAAAIAHANAFKTGIVAFSYNIKTMLLPFFFILNPAILLYKVNTAFEVVYIFIVSIIGILAITASTQQYLIVKNRIHETVLLFLIGLSFLSPYTVINVIVPPFSAIKIDSEVLDKINNGSKLRLLARWENFAGDLEDRVIVFESKQGIAIKDQLNDFGIKARYGDAESLDVIKIRESSKAFVQIGSRDHIQIIGLYLINVQPDKAFAYLSSFFLLIIVYYLQYKRKKRLIHNA